MRSVVFMGSPDFAVSSLQALIDSPDYDVKLVVSQTDKPQGRKQILTAPPVKQLALQYDLPVYQPKTLRTPEAYDTIRALQPDFIVVSAYGKILPQNILDIPKYGCVNLHGSLLPKYRGAAPIQWSVINGDTHTGVTSMLMNAGLDTGDILLTAETEIGENETAGELFDRLAALCPALLLQTLGASFGVHVDGYVAVNYALMSDLVDAIGGVQLEVTADELKKLNGILEYYNHLRGAPKDEGLLIAPGMQTLNGLQTMSYARIRKLDSDFVRVQRQQKVILAIYDQLRTLDLLTLTGVITQYISQVGTNVTLAKAASLVASVLARGGEVAVDTLRVPVEHAYTPKMLHETYYVVPNLEKCQTAIHDFLYGQEE